MHQLDLRYAALRIADPMRRARLAVSIAQSGQQSPVLVVAGDDDRFVLIDGYARVAALAELGRDLVSAAVLELSESEALILAHRLESKRRRSALEEGWLIAELIEAHGLSLQVVAGRLQRSVSWVSRRLGLVTALPEAAQEAVKSGKVPAHAAAKYLVPLARANGTDCERLVASLGPAPVSVREVERLYLGWKSAEADARDRIVSHPRLFLKAEKAVEPAPAVPAGDPASPLVQDIEGLSGLARRARRRVRNGVLDELDASRRRIVSRSFDEARLAFDSLFELVEECGLCSTTPPAAPS